MQLESNKDSGANAAELSAKLEECQASKEHLEQSCTQLTSDKRELIEKVRANG